MISFVLNFPYTVIGLLVSILSFPVQLQFRKNPYAFVVKIKSFWWAVGYMRGTRAATIGQVVLLGPKVEMGDLEHELVHVGQYQRMPLIHPILYYIELARKGYKENKYEKEAYKLAENRYNEIEN